MKGPLNGIRVLTVETFIAGPMASMWLADAENFPMPMAMFALISRMFDPGIAAIASLMILMSIVIVAVLERLTGLQRAMSV